MDKDKKAQLIQSLQYSIQVFQNAIGVVSHEGLQIRLDALIYIQQGQLEKMEKQGLKGLEYDQSIMLDTILNYTANAFEYGLPSAQSSIVSAACGYIETNNKKELEYIEKQTVERSILIEIADTKTAIQKLQDALVEARTGNGNDAKILASIIVPNIAKLKKNIEILNNKLKSNHHAAPITERHDDATNGKPTEPKSHRNESHCSTPINATPLSGSQSAA